MFRRSGMNRMVTLKRIGRYAREVARRWFPKLFVRLSSADVRRAEMEMQNLTPEEIAAGRKGVRAAIQEARRRSPGAGTE